MKPLAAEVLYNGKVAGVLRRSANQFSFRYSPDYLASDLPAISLTLPKQEGVFVSPVLFSFFPGCWRKAQPSRFSVVSWALMRRMKCCAF
ncbi:HipA N-terminal domain-containing protein [Hymenobacter weizhouensis]|uniref:HipA N-terminal domain-containing protein n=1 Tax=Hymenobacter sp. YIM 151500-1 TaxID=2987689 RepID=UPI0022277AC7|nr:HipA N-terminal domain-containing protein [Hymenobacter sp. YIM 151500-1]UYZ61897.1 HipA N-terminal domain-containing protein [Hymenobacter sp. YIM 151500-1]